MTHCILRNPVVVGGATISDDEIWEWDPDSGLVQKRFGSFDFFPPDEYEGPGSKLDDWFHANSLTVGPRGNIVVSYLFLDKIASVASDFRSVEWTLGGVNSTFRLSDSAVFSGQHSAAELASGNILLFDNGVSRISSEQYSRALELVLDPGGRTADVAWEFRPMPDNYARAVSSAVRMGDGNTFVSFGLIKGSAGEGLGGPIAIYEVTPENRVAWHLEVIGETPSMCRARPLSHIAGEVAVPEGESR